jgi:MoaA/NifB/PqqE/SkfB family radical SAM enzyme
MTAAAVDTAPDLPRELQIEVTGACNLRCHMCLVRYRPPLNRITGSLSFDTFKRLIDDLPDLEVITLQGLGEPLLAPDLLPMIEYAARRGIRLGFNTNGTLLSREKAERLIAAGLDWLHVSLDGATASTYERIRDGSSFARVRQNILSLVDAKRRLGAEAPRLSLVFVAMRRNVHELPEMVRLAADWGVGRLWVQNLSHSFDDCDPAGDYQAIRDFAAAEALWAEADTTTREVFDRARTLAAEHAVELRLPRLQERPPSRRRPGTPGCDWPWRSAYVTHDARVQPCCMLMGGDRGVLGDVSRDSFASVWRGGAYREFRGRLLTSEPPEVCRGCSLYRGVF